MRVGLLGGEWRRGTNCLGLSGSTDNPFVASVLAFSLNEVWPAIGQTAEIGGTGGMGAK